MRFPYWIAAVRVALGIRSTERVNDFFQAWWQWEGGGNPARGTPKFNWLCSTTPVAGSTRFFTDPHEPAVQNYPTWASGVYATVKTLRQAKYAGLVRALKSGDPLAPAVRADVRAGLSTWVSGSPIGDLAYADRVIETAGALA